METWQVGEQITEHHEPSGSRRALAALPPPRGSGSHEANARDYRPDPALLEAINDAIAACMPLLIEGEAGTGKTAVAYYLSAWFGIRLYPFTVKSNSLAEQLKWEMDHVGYLRSASAPGAEHAPREKFLTKGPLWLALSDPEPSVVLIDEVDKAPREFPNDLLHELDQSSIPHPFDSQVTIRREAARPPIFVITSNGERPLPEPFVRRCMRHRIELNNTMLERAWLARGVETDPELIRVALDRFDAVRSRMIQKKPAIGEFISWMSLLRRKGVTPAQLRAADLRELPGLRVLVKYEEDQQQL